MGRGVSERQIKREITKKYYSPDKKPCLQEFNSDNFLISFNAYWLYFINFNLSL
jgi:hypothetical protein